MATVTGEEAGRLLSFASFYLVAKKINQLLSDTP